MYIKTLTDDVGLSDHINNLLPPYETQNVVSMFEEFLITTETINTGVYRRELEEIVIRDTQCDSLFWTMKSGKGKIQLCMS
jgi:hypothetical protein